MLELHFLKKIVSAAEHMNSDSEIGKEKTITVCGVYIHIFLFYIFVCIIAEICED